MKEIFLLESISITPQISINLLFDKDMNYRELIECYIEIQINLEEETFKRIKKLRYVFNDRIISFDRLVNFIQNFLKEITEIIEAIDSGINLSSEFYSKFKSLNNSNIQLRKEIKTSIEELSEYKLQPYIIKLYTLLTSYKGTDILQKKKYQKMIESQELSMLYNLNKGTNKPWK